MISNKCSIYFVTDSMWEFEHVLVCPVIVCLAWWVGVRARMRCVVVAAVT